MFIEIAGWIATGLFFISYFPQLWKTYRWKEVNDLSPGMWWVLLGAYGALAIHAVGINSVPLMLNSLLGIWCVAIMLLMYYIYRDTDKQYIKKIIKEVIRDAKKKKT